MIPPPKGPAPDGTSLTTSTPGAAAPTSPAQHGEADGRPRVFSAPGFAFPKSARVRKRPEFLRVQSRGRRVHTEHFTLIVLDRGDGEPARLGLTTARKVGPAVVRNRARRVLREVFRLHRERFPRGHDVVVIVKDSAPFFTFISVRDELLAALARPSSSRRGPEAPGAKGSRDAQHQPRGQGVQRPDTRAPSRPAPTKPK